MDTITVTLKTLSGAKLLYNVLQQTFEPHMIDEFLVMRYVINGARWDLKHAECPEIYHCPEFSQVYLGGHSGYNGTLPHVEGYAYHREALNDLRSVLAVLLHYTRDNGIAFSQRE